MGDCPLNLVIHRNRQWGFSVFGSSHSVGLFVYTITRDLIELNASILQEYGYPFNSKIRWQFPLILEI